MARMFGRMGSWLWWVMGLLLALVFGRGAEARAEAVPEYGVRVRPPVKQPAVTEEQKQKAEKLIDEYLAAEVNPPAPSAEDQAKIDGLIKELSAKEFAAREAASAGLVKIGRPALAALKKAAESKDPEVAWRAKAAIEKIGDGPEVEGLRSLGWPAQTAVRERADKEKKAMTSAAGEAEGAGKKEEAEKLRAEAKAAQARAELLAKLAAKVAPKMEIIRTHPCEMAPMPRPAPPDPPPPPPNPPLK